MPEVKEQIPSEIIEKAKKLYRNKSDVRHFILKSGGKVEFLPKNLESDL